MKTNWADILMKIVWCLKFKYRNKTKMMKLLKTDKNSHKSFMVEGRTVLEMELICQRGLEDWVSPLEFSIRWCEEKWSDERNDERWRRREEYDGVEKINEATIKGTDER